MPRLFASMMRFSIWSLTPSPCRPPIAVRFGHQFDRVGELDAVQRDRQAFVEAHADFLALDGDVVAPRRHAHDRLHDAHVARQLLEVLRLVRRAEHVGVGRVRLLGRHLVGEARLSHELRHLGAAAEFVDERLVEPRLVDLQARVGEQAVAVEPLDVVALERAAVAPDVDVVFLHRGDEHRAGHGAADRRRVEVGDAGRRDVERAALQRRDAFGDELRAAVDQARLLGAVLQRAAGNVVVVRFVGLAEVRRVRERDRALLAHPEERGARIEAAGERDADLLAGGKLLQDRRHFSVRAPEERAFERGEAARWPQRERIIPDRGRPRRGRSARTRGAGGQRTLRPEQQVLHQGLLHVQAVFGFVPDDRLRAVEHLRGHFFAAVRRQAVHEDRVRRGDTASCRRRPASRRRRPRARRSPPRSPCSSRRRS